jgi:Fe-S oxidoreductase
MATKNEKHTTRARANIMREVLTHSTKENRFDSEEIKEVMDLCLSCKGCKSECPSNVDVAKLKAEFYQQYYKKNGVPFRSKMFANVTATNKLGSKIPKMYNFFSNNALTGGLIKKVMGVHPNRDLPLLSTQTLSDWFKQNKVNNFGEKADKKVKKVVFFNDEFTNYNDAHEGKIAIKLLTKLGYEVIMPTVNESGRT